MHSERERERERERVGAEAGGCEPVVHVPRRQLSQEPVDCRERPVPCVYYRQLASRVLDRARSVPAHHPAGTQPDAHSHTHTHTHTHMDIHAYTNMWTCTHAVQTTRSRSRTGWTTAATRRYWTCCRFWTPSATATMCALCSLSALRDGQRVRISLPHTERKRERETMYNTSPPPKKKHTCPLVYNRRAESRAVAPLVLATAAARAGLVGAHLAAPRACTAPLRAPTV
jgi:hypothetical protein